MNILFFILFVIEDFSYKNIPLFGFLGVGVLFCPLCFSFYTCFLGLTRKKRMGATNTQVNAFLVNWKKKMNVGDREKETRKRR